MKKHPFNLFPDMSDEEYILLKSDINNNGYDKTYPVILYNGEILDGWHRYKVCQELKIEPVTVNFDGGDTEAIKFVIRTNKRRSLSSLQRAAVSRKYDTLINTLQQEAKKKQVEAGKKYGEKHPKKPQELGQKFGQPLNQPKPKREQRTSEILADEFDTNKTYVSAISWLEKNAPDKVDLAIKGEFEYSDIKKLRKSKQLEIAKTQIANQTKQSPNPPIIYNESYETWLPKQDMCDLLLTDPPYMTDIQDISSFAKAWLPLALSKIKDTGRAYVFIGAYPEEIQAYLNVKMPNQILVWTYRNTLGPSPKFGYKLNWQAILYYEMKNVKPLDCPIMLEQFTVQDISAPDGRQYNRYHEWQKPMEIAERFIRHSTKENDLVLDPFCCTGTFPLAASKLGRIGIGCDTSKDNLNIATQRGCILK